MICPLENIIIVDDAAVSIKYIESESIIESRVDGTWHGWDSGGTVLRLTNDQIWEQKDSYSSMLSSSFISPRSEQLESRQLSPSPTSTNSSIICLTFTC